MSFQIIANKQNLDTYEGEDISLNYQNSDIFDISKRNTNWSKTILLPGTPTNNLFFKQIFDVNIDNISFNPNKAIQAEIRIGDNSIFSGKLRLINITKDNGRVEYQINVLGALRNIISDFGDNNLDQLDFSEYNHTRNTTTIQDSWTYNSVYYGNTTSFYGQARGYVYPYIINGANSDFTNYWYSKDAFPALYIREIIYKMAEYSGYTFTSNFFDSEYFKKLILPFTENNIQIADEVFEERIVRAGLTPDYVDVTPIRYRDTDWWYNNAWGYNFYLTRESGTVSDNGNDLEFTDDLGQYTAGVFTANTTGRYDIAFDAKLIPHVFRVDGSGDLITGNIQYKEDEFEYRYQMYKVFANGSTSQLLDSSIDPNDPNDIYGVLKFGLDTDQKTITNASEGYYYFNNQLICQMSADNVLLEAGDKIVVRLGFKYTKVKWNGGLDNRKLVSLSMKQQYNDSYSKFTAVPSSHTSYGNDPILMNQILPTGIKMKDFFLNIIKMFNLVVQDNPNKDNDLLIEPMDDFFKSKQKVKDWTYKLDNDSKVVITPMSELDAKSYLYTYKEDDDYYNKLYSNTSSEIYGEYEVEAINDFTDKVNKTELIFSPTPNADAWLDGRSAPFFTERNGDVFTPKKAKMRILFYDGLVNCNTFKLAEYEGATPINISSYPYCGMFNKPNDAEYDLGFGPTKELYWTPNAFPTLNLFNKFHKSRIETIVDINARLMEASFHLTPKDIANFDFRDIIFIENSYWRVNEIKDYNPIGSDSLTTVVLYKLLNLNILNKYSVSITGGNIGCPTDININTSSGFYKKNYYQSLSGQTITEACCSSLSGSYVNGICYVGASTGVEAKPGTIVRLPVLRPYSADDYNIDGNTRNSPNTAIYGKRNYIPEGLDGSVIIGDNNSVQNNLKNIIIIGDNINANQSGTVYIGNIKIGEDGSITSDGLEIIDGGEDVVFPLGKTTYIDVIDGSEDVVMQLGGDDKSTPIRDGGVDGNFTNS